MKYIEVKQIPASAINQIYTASSYPAGVYSYLNSIYFNTGLCVILLDHNMINWVVEDTPVKESSNSSNSFSENLLLKAMAIAQDPSLATTLIK